MDEARIASQTRSPIRTAIVTGAARGIGAAAAADLAAQGRRVAVVDKDVDAASRVAASISTAGGCAEPFEADIAEPEAVEAVVQQVTATLGAPTIVVNNAGFARDVPFSRMTLAEWDAVMDVHLRGSFLVLRATSRHMIEAGWGRIVNVSSISALGGEGRANYAAAKSGMHGLIKALALELGPHGVTANVVAPGFTNTAMTAATARALGRTVDEHQRIAAASLPVRRFGQPTDIARAITFFTDDSAGFITGQVLYVSGAPHG